MLFRNFERVEILSDSESTCDCLQRSHAPSYCHNRCHHCHCYPPHTIPLPSICPIRVFLTIPTPPPHVAGTTTSRSQFPPRLLDLLPPLHLAPRPDREYTTGVLASPPRLPAVRLQLEVAPGVVWLNRCAARRRSSLVPIMAMAAPRRGVGEAGWPYWFGQRQHIDTVIHFKLMKSISSHWILCVHFNTTLFPHSKKYYSVILNVFLLSGNVLQSLQFAFAAILRSLIDIAMPIVLEIYSVKIIFSSIEIFLLDVSPNLFIHTNHMSHHYFISFCFSVPTCHYGTM